MTIVDCRLSIVNRFNHEGYGSQCRSQSKLAFRLTVEQAFQPARFRTGKDARSTNRQAGCLCYSHDLVDEKRARFFEHLVEFFGGHFSN